MNEYICKGAISSASADFLVAEFILSKTAQKLGFNCPETNILEVNTDHRPEIEMMRQIGIQWHIPAFASKRKTSAIDINNENSQLVIQSIKKQKRELQLLKTLFFDVWVANEDRNTNYNLLFDFNNAHPITLIDHEMAFNTCSAIDYGLSDITFEDSLANTYLFEKLFSKSKNMAALKEEVLASSSKWPSLIAPFVHEWLEECPKAWVARKSRWIDFLEHEWLSETWMKQVRENYVNLLQLLHKSQ